MKISAAKSEAIIIGGGFAGLSLAVFLAELGYQITLLEKKPLLGGRTYAFVDRKTKCWVDNGQHLLMGAYHETLRLIDIIGANYALCSQKQEQVPLILDSGQKINFKNHLMGILGFQALSWRDKFNLISLYRSLKNSDKLSSLTVRQWLVGEGQSLKSQKNFWDILTLATLNDDPEIACAKNLATVIKTGFLGNAHDARVIFPKTNLNDLLAKPAKAYLELRGHKIIRDARVDRIHILDEKIQSIELADGTEYKADLYASAVPFQALLQIIPPGFVDSLPYFSNLKKLETSPIVSINLWYDKEIFEDFFVGSAYGTVHWFFNRNRISDTTHPPYHYMGVVSGARHLLDASRDEIVEIAKKEIEILFPKAKGATMIHSFVNKEREATLSTTPASELLRPEIQSPFENLLIVGDWVKTGLPATIESAVLSARKAAGIVKLRLEKKEKVSLAG